METNFRNAYLLLLATAATMICLGCSSSKGTDSKTQPPKNDVVLSKSELSEKDLENLRVWRYYQRDSEPYAASSPEIIAFSTDGRFSTNVTFFKNYELGNDQCGFYMVSKVKLEDSGGVKTMTLTGTPEFIFSYGILRGESKSIDSLQRPEQREEAARLCFERFSLFDLAAVLQPDEAYPKVNFGKIITQTNEEVTFQAFKPTDREMSPTPASYRFERLKPGAWVREQNCDLPSNTCLP